MRHWRGVAAISAQADMARLATAMALSGGLAFVAPRAVAPGLSTPARHGAASGGSAAWVPVTSAAVAAVVAAKGRSARRAVGVCLPLTAAGRSEPWMLGPRTSSTHWSWARRSGWSAIAKWRSSTAGSP